MGKTLTFDEVRDLRVGSRFATGDGDAWQVTNAREARNLTTGQRRGPDELEPLGPFALLREALPDATADGYDWPTGDSIAHEAHTLVYGDRNDGYGHPRRNFTRIAHMWTALLSDKLGEGEYVTPEDVGRCMVAMKLSRDVNNPKRDNRVDMAGYAIALDRLETGK